MKKILSILIPSYNIEKYIDECVPSYISKELFDDVDVFFIDDGATDKTKEKLDQYLNNHKNYFRFIHKDNGGHGSVINYGVYNLVNTKYFKVIDGDDWVDTNNLIKLVNELKKTDADVVINSHILKSNKSSKIAEPSTKTPGLYSVEEAKDFLFSIHSLTFKTSIFTSNSIVVPEKVFYEDNIYCVLPFKYIKTILLLDYPVYIYRIGNSSQSVSILSMIKHLNDLVLVNETLFAEYEKNLNNQSYSSIVLLRLIGGLRQEFLIRLQKKAPSKYARQDFIDFDKRYKLNKTAIESELKKNCKAYKYLKQTNYHFVKLARRVWKNRF